ncbi:hypothetical protein [Candidatus Pyrohabitans sp.]
MKQKVHAPLAAGAVYPGTQEGAYGEPMSFIISFCVIAVALLLDCLFRRLGD